MANKRIFYACEQIGFNQVGSTAFTVAHGVRSVGINTKYNLEQIFEIGQISIYANMEQVADIEVNIEKVLDGYPLIYHLATIGSTAATLTGRSTAKAAMALSIFSDQQNSASGTPITQTVCSGLFVSNVEYRVPQEGAVSEAVTLVGNNKYWLNSGFTFTGAMLNNDSPLAGTASGQVQHRQDLVMGKCLFPTDIAGMSASGTNDLQGDGNFAVHLASLKTSTNLGRQALYELGRKAPYFRYVQFPVQVTTEIETTSIQGDQMSAVETALQNVNEQKIFLQFAEGTKIDLGPHNKCQSVTYSGGNAEQGGGNVTATYSYLTFNDFTVTHPADPTTALAQ